MNRYEEKKEYAHRRHICNNKRGNTTREDMKGYDKKGDKKRCEKRGGDERRGEEQINNIVYQTMKIQ